MAEMLIRPSMKFIKLGYALVLLLVLAAVGLWATVLNDAPWLPIIPAVLFVWPVQRHIRRGFTQITVAGDKLRYETGFLSKTTRTIQLPKVQDIRVDQTLAQRMYGVGSLSIETAGETSRLTIVNIDRPQEVADYIIDLAHHDAERSHNV